MQITFRHFLAQKSITALFIFWFLLFPFDAQVLPVSIGIMTIYPALILTFILLLCTLFAKKTQIIDFADKIIMLFFFIWCIYGIAYLPIVKEKTYALYDIRSLIMMAVTISMLFLTRYVMGKKHFFAISYQLSVFVFITLTSFALFEFFTGIHFKGKFTELLWNLPVENITYAPLFLYDNPNTFLCYLFGFALLIFITQDKKQNFKNNLLIIAVLLFFSIIGDSQSGKLSACLLFVSNTIHFIITDKYYIIKKYYAWFLLSTGFILFCLFTKEIYFGPIWKNGEHYLINSINLAKTDKDTIRFYPADSLLKNFSEEDIIKSYRTYQSHNKDKSINVRINLIKNGLFLTQQSNFLGVGPGQFMWYHDNHKVPHPTGTINSVHSGPIEILSQYGLLIFIPYLILFLYYWFKKIKSDKFNLNALINTTVIYIVFVLISCMSSAFLILNIGWMLTAFLLLSSSTEKNV